MSAREGIRGNGVQKEEKRRRRKANIFSHCPALVFATTREISGWLANSNTGTVRTWSKRRWRPERQTKRHRTHSGTQRMWLPSCRRRRRRRVARGLFRAHSFVPFVFCFFFLLSLILPPLHCDRSQTGRRRIEKGREASRRIRNESIGVPRRSCTFGEGGLCIIDIIITDITNKWLRLTEGSVVSYISGTSVVVSSRGLFPSTAQL